MKHLLTKAKKTRKSPNHGLFLFVFFYIGKHMNNEEVVVKIQRYFEKYLFEPRQSWPKEKFLKRVYERWTVRELIFQILDNPFIEADEIIWSFALQMEEFHHISNNDETRKIFYTAGNTAEDLLSLIL